MSAQALAGLKAFWEGLTPERLAGIDAVYAPDAHFRDPFNDVRGIEELRRIFGHMYETLDEPRFVIRDAIAEGDQVFLSWDFLFRMRRFDRREQCVRGGSQLRFAPDGRIADHRDYWDVAEELYEKLPVLGALMRWLKRRATT